MQALEALAERLAAVEREIGMFRLLLEQVYGERLEAMQDPATAGVEVRAQQELPPVGQTVRAKTMDGHWFDCHVDESGGWWTRHSFGWQPVRIVAWWREEGGEV